MEWKRVLSGRIACKRRVSLSCQSVQCGLLQHGSAACLGSEEGKCWGFQSRSDGETKGQECWQRMVEVKMERSKELGDLLDFRISQVECFKPWTCRRGEAPLCLTFSFPQSRRHVTLLGQILGY